MKILLPKELGFCNGVSSAINKALSLRRKAYCIGQIVHNKEVSQDLEKHGVVFVERIDDVPDGETLIIRAHGVGKDVFLDAEKRGINIVDATCPSVKAIQRKAERYFNKGYRIVLVGDAAHPEIAGINGWCGNSALIFDGKSKLELKNADKALIMFQTTFDCRFFEKSLQNISTEGVKTLEIFNTICYTTLQRQYYAQMLSSQCDLAVVVGDCNSSNTQRLYEIASENCRTVLTDGKDLNIDFTNCKNVCVISGASTPTELIKGVLRRMIEDAKETVSVETVESDVMVAEKTMSKDEAMLAQAVSEMKEGHRYKLGQKVKCRVTLVDTDGIYVRIPGSKKDGFIPDEELCTEGSYQDVKSTLEEGAMLECAIISLEKGITLSKKVIDERYKDDELVAGIKEGNEFTCVMTRVGKECLTGKLGSYTVIVHASQIKIGYVKNLETYIGKPLRLVVSGPDKVDDSKRVIRASQKTILLAEKKAREDEFWNNIEVGEIVEGKVLRFASFGAFVSVRGFDCLAHTSDLAWEHVKGPQDVLEIGNTYEFVVLALDREKNRVSLGYKQLQPQPWQLAEEKFPVGAVVTGKVARIMPFGAFIELDKHIDGLLHVSNVSWEWLDDINKALKVGDEIEVEVMEFDAENKRITLSRKSLLPRPDQVGAAKEDAE
ncbi:MAG: 4-hydroxy-3-methylbut-2-enyl diphosphate reductase [Corallococcus sp.]|nr:4-hydroxy-3-methylbut-2-enyl diphosphate reductase [Bacillota bacterium]MCM1533540.1 4-hydroxy-3-methylbut-2-enyl diphosphate reductase [Corallococcus sp.]